MSRSVGVDGEWIAQDHELGVENLRALGAEFADHGIAHALDLAHHLGDGNVKPLYLGIDLLGRDVPARDIGLGGNQRRDHAPRDTGRHRNAGEDPGFGQRVAQVPGMGLSSRGSTSRALARRALFLFLEHGIIELCFDQPNQRVHGIDLVLTIRGNGEFGTSDRREHGGCP